MQRDKTKTVLSALRAARTEALRYFAPNEKHTHHRLAQIALQAVADGERVHGLGEIARAANFVTLAIEANRKARAAYKREHPILGLFL